MAEKPLQEAGQTEIEMLRAEVEQHQARWEFLQYLARVIGPPITIGFKDGRVKIGVLPNGTTFEDETVEIAVDLVRNNLGLIYGKGMQITKSEKNRG